MRCMTAGRIIARPPGFPSFAPAGEEVGHRRGINGDSADIVITPGAKPIMFFAIPVLVDQDDQVLYPDPGFPIYESMIDLVGGCPVTFRFVEDLKSNVDVGEIVSKITPRTRLVILNFSQNPTGGVMSRAEVATLAEVLAGRDIFALSEEVYSRLILGGEHTSLAQFPAMKERTIILDSFSTIYAMTGWRLGYGVMRLDLTRRVSPLMTNSNSCTASVMQIAAIEAFKGNQDSVDMMRGEFGLRRTVIVGGIEPHSGLSLQDTSRSLLRLHAHHGNQTNFTRTGRRFAQRCGRCLSFPHIFRRMGRRIPTVLLRQFGKEHTEGIGPNRNLGQAKRLIFKCDETREPPQGQIRITESLYLVRWNNRNIQAFAKHNIRKRDLNITVGGSRRSVCS